MQEKYVNGFGMGSDSVSEYIDQWFQIKNWMLKLTLKKNRQTRRELVAWEIVSEWIDQLIQIKIIKSHQVASETIL